MCIGDSGQDPRPARAARATRIALILSTTGLAVVGLWRSPAGLIAGTAILALGVALFTPALFALAVEGIPAAN